MKRIQIRAGKFVTISAALAAKAERVFAPIATSPDEGESVSLPGRSQSGRRDLATSAIGFRARAASDRKGGQTEATARADRQDAACLCVCGQTVARALSFGAHGHERSDFPGYERERQPVAWLERGFPDYIQRIMCVM